MTKRVRIENADVAMRGIIVEVWEKTLDGSDTHTSTHRLDHPTDIIELFIYGSAGTVGRYLVIREAA
jgi:hypothetical protein